MEVPLDDGSGSTITERFADGSATARAIREAAVEFLNGNTEAQTATCPTAENDADPDATWALWQYRVDIVPSASFNPTLGLPHTPNS